MEEQIVREIKGLKFRESQFIKPEETYQVSYDIEIQNKTEGELAIRIASSKEHKTLQESFGKMSVHVLQIYEEPHENIDELKEQVLFLQATVKAQADLIDKYHSSVLKEIKE